MAASGFMQTVRFPNVESFERAVVTGDLGTPLACDPTMWDLFTLQLVHWVRSLQPQSEVSIESR